MKVGQIYTRCLAQCAYYIDSHGDAAATHPWREVQPYLYRARPDKVKIKYVFETDFHADFVSGQVDLSNKTEAQVVYGPNAICDFGCISATNGEEFKIGFVTIKVLHTPGYTMESTTFLFRLPPKWPVAESKTAKKAEAILLETDPKYRNFKAR